MLHDIRRKVGEGQHRRLGSSYEEKRSISLLLSVNGPPSTAPYQWTAPAGVVSQHRASVSVGAEGKRSSEGEETQNEKPLTELTDTGGILLMLIFVQGFLSHFLQLRCIFFVFLLHHVTLNGGKTPY